MRKFLIYFLIAFICVIVFGGRNANSGQESLPWIEGSGEAIADQTRPIKEVIDEAITNARRLIVERALGVKIQSESNLKNFILESDFISTISSGHIVEEKIVQWKADLIQDNSLSPPIPRYKVFIRARVAADVGQPDPSFKIRAFNDRSVYKSGDGVQLKIRSTQDCYLTIFVLTEENKAYLIFPNTYKKDNFLKAGDEFIFPSEKDIAKGIVLKAGLLPGNAKAKEMLRVLATKKQLRLTPEIYAEGIGLESYSKETASFKELLRELMMIPADQRTEAVLSYEIVK